MQKLNLKFLGCLLIPFILIGIMFSMGLFTWSSLPKDQTSNQTISEAITEAIIAHEQDPTAHLGDGESLEQHKSNEVIDHPAQSIVPDKLFGGDIVIKTNFESISAWGRGGETSAMIGDGLNLYTEYGAVNTSWVVSTYAIAPYLFNAVSDIYFETEMKYIGGNSHLNAWFGFNGNYTSTTSGFGYQIRDGVLYAHVRRGTTTVDNIITGFVLSNDHFYTALFSYADQTVTFKIDGVVVAVVSVPSGTNWNDDRTPAFGVTLTQSNANNMFFSYCYAWRKVLTL